MFKVRNVFQKKHKPKGVVIAGRGAQAGASVTLQCLSQLLSVTLTACAGVVRLSSKYCGII